MHTDERYPARWPSNRQALLVCSALAGAVIVGALGALLGFNSGTWDWTTTFGGVGAGAAFWAAEVLL